MKKTYVLLILIFLLSSLALPQTTAKKDPWEPLKFLEGKWEDIKPGVSTNKQTYRFVMNNKYLGMKTKAVFEPTDKKPKGEIHEDAGMISYDNARKTFVMRCFYIEGFVIQYTLAISEDGKVLTFSSKEAIENAPPGTKAKLVFKKISNDQFEEKFFVAWPKKDYTCFVTNNLKRVK
jgi:hypothetical protein